MTNSVGLIKALLTLIKYDLIQATRQPAEALQPLLFFLLISTLFALTAFQEVRLLPLIAPSVIWVSALLAALFMMEKLFLQDEQANVWEHYLISPLPRIPLMMSKLIAHWILSALPLLLITPLIALLFQLPWPVWTTLWISLLLATPTLSTLVLIASSLTVGLGSRGFLLAALVLPLLVPVVIFSLGAVAYASEGLNTLAPLALLLAILLLSLMLGPIGAAAALNIGLNE